MPSRLDNALAKVKALQPQVEAKLQALADPRLPNNLLTAAEDAVNEQGMMEQIIVRRFASKSTNGRPWAADKASTVRGKAKKGQPGDPLAGTGALKAGAIAAVEGTFTMRGPITWDINRIGVRYAKPANKARPFFHPPSADELRPAFKAAGVAMATGIKAALG